MFVTDYCKGAIAFVDEYWRIIHRGAGWSALRFLLLVRFFLYLLAICRR